MVDEAATNQAPARSVALTTIDSNYACRPWQRVSEGNLRGNQVRSMVSPRRLPSKGTKIANARESDSIRIPPEFTQDCQRRQDCHQISPPLLEFRLLRNRAPRWSSAFRRFAGSGRCRTFLEPVKHFPARLFQICARALPQAPAASAIEEFLRARFFATAFDLRAHQWPATRAFEPCPGRSDQNASNRFSAAANLHGTAEAVRQARLGVEAQAMVDRRGDVLRGDRIRRGIFSMRVA